MDPLFKGVKKFTPLLFTCSADEGGALEKRMKTGKRLVGKPFVTADEVTQYAVCNHGNTLLIQLSLIRVISQNQFIKIKL